MLRWLWLEVASFRCCIGLHVVFTHWGIQGRMDWIIVAKKKRFLNSSSCSPVFKLFPAISPYWKCTPNSNLTFPSPVYQVLHMASRSLPKSLLIFRISINATTADFGCQKCAARSTVTTYGHGRGMLLWGLSAHKAVNVLADCKLSILCSGVCVSFRFISSASLVLSQFL